MSSVCLCPSLMSNFSKVIIQIYTSSQIWAFQVIQNFSNIYIYIFIIRVMMVHKTIWFSNIDFNKASSVHCKVHPLPQAKSLPVPTSPLFAHLYLISQPPNSFTFFQIYHLISSVSSFSSTLLFWQLSIYSCTWLCFVHYFILFIIFHLQVR